MNLLDTVGGRRWLFAALYLSEGAPMGFIWWALPTLLTRRGVALADITVLTSTATLPWVFKFVAGPIIDASTVRGVTLRRWILVCQSAMVLTLLPIAVIDWVGSFGLLTVCLVVHAVFAATQDVAIDTLAIRTVPAEELGRINGWMQSGMLTGRATIAACSVLIIATGGPPAVVGILVVVIALPMILVITAIREGAAPSARASGPREWLAAVAGRGAAAGLLIALTAGAGFEFLGTAAGPLMVELGAADATVSMFFGVLAPGALIAGSLLGGMLTDRLGKVRATGAGVVAVGLLAAALALLLTTGVLSGASRYVPWLVITYVGIGFLTAASYALFMQLARGRYSATRFSMFMAATNGCEAWAGFAGGQMKAPLGYPLTLLALVAASAVSLPLLWLLDRARPDRGS